MLTTVKELDVMDCKKISISEKRQITIPKTMFVELGFTDKAQCYVKDGSLIITPIQYSDGEFATEILENLIRDGYEGEALLNKFKEMQAKIRPAVNKMLQEARQLAENSNESDAFDEIFS